MSALPILVTKALTDTGYDLIEAIGEEWFLARVSGSAARVAVQPMTQGTILAVPEVRMTQRIGLASVESQAPTGMNSVGLANGPSKLYQALRILHSLQMHPVASLTKKMETRLASIPETERTKEVKQRIGQDVFREALMELWEGRCALSNVTLPPSLLRASHAKPWATSSDAERLDPFNGLLLAVHFDALFDQGLIAFDDDGRMMLSSQLTNEVRKLLTLDEHSAVRFVLPGHIDYFRHHRVNVFRP